MKYIKKLMYLLLSTKLINTDIEILWRSIRVSFWKII